MAGRRHQTGCPAGKAGENEGQGGFPPPPEQEAMSARRSSSEIAAIVLIAACWLAGVVGPPVVLLRTRAAWLESLDRPEAQEQWDAFRADMRRQTGREGPVQRKVPKSAEPPLRVWLRDRVWLAIAAWAVLAGALGLFTGMLAWGAVRRPVDRRLLAEDQSGRGGDDEKQDERDAEDAQVRKHVSRPSRGV